MDVLQSPIAFSKNGVGEQSNGYRQLKWLGFQPRRIARVCSARQSKKLMTAIKEIYWAFVSGQRRQKKQGKKSTGQPALLHKIQNHPIASPEK
jgi:hypothetical protein